MPADHRRIATFSLSGDLYGIDMRHLVEIREWQEPTPLPRVPGYLRGVMDHNGRVIPVIDLGARLGRRASRLHDTACVLIVALGDDQAGFVVDDLSDIVLIDAAVIRPAAAITRGDPGLVIGDVGVALRGDAGECRSAFTLLNLGALGVGRQMRLAA